MFFTYLRRELRRRMRQAVFIALGLALGVGLVITVTAASAGVRNAQGTVLHALYGVGTDVTVAKTPKAGSFSPGSFGFGFRAGSRSRPVAGTKINDSTLAASPTLASISSSSVTSVAGLHDVSRRVREFGTLKALGWKSRRIIGQVMGEAVALGVIGGAIGVGLGLADAELVSRLAPKLSTVVGQTTGSATPGGARQFGFGGAGTGGSGGAGGGGGGGGFGRNPGAATFRNAASASHTVAVHLSAAVSANATLLAVVLAVAGGIIAGIFGGWRAARLRPAAALAKVA